MLRICDTAKTHAFKLIVEHFFNTFILMFFYFQATDKDTVIDANALTYELTEGAVSGDGMTDVPIDCIVIDKNTGALKTEFDFTDAMKGYITYTAVVYDSGNLHQNTAHVQVIIILEVYCFSCFAFSSID